VTAVGSSILAASATLDRVCLTAAKAAVVGMVAVIMLQVVSRYGLHQPPAWTEELARYLMVWGGLLGATSAFRRAVDPAVVVADETAGTKAALLAKVAVALTTIIFVGPILYYALVGPNFDLGRSFLMRNAARNSAGLGINLVFIAAAIPAFCTILFVHLAARLVGGPVRNRQPEVM
jgi:TRAP-type C4-dicarboxylate transport system permease small subunit